MLKKCSRARPCSKAYLPARCLAEAGLQENFALHMDERGNVVGVDYTTAGGECHLDAMPVPLGEAQACGADLRNEKKNVSSSSSSLL